MTSIDERYMNFLFIKVNVLPSYIIEYHPYENNILILGYSPNYFVRVSLMLSKQWRSVLFNFFLAS
jgi:hypothetical protein